MGEFPQDRRGISTFGCARAKGWCGGSAEAGLDSFPEQAQLRCPSTQGALLMTFQSVASAPADVAYFSRRFDEETRAAKAACCHRVRRAHAEMAFRYAVRLASLEHATGIGRAAGQGGSDL